jgi:hypothetical protein
MMKMWYVLLKPSRYIHRVRACGVICDDNREVVEGAGAQRVSQTIVRVGEAVYIDLYQMSPNEVPHDVPFTKKHIHRSIDETVTAQNGNDTRLGVTTKLLPVLHIHRIYERANRLLYAGQSCLDEVTR